MDARRTRDVLLVALTFSAGSIDAISYLGLGRVFTSNMTGNTILLGMAAAQGQLLGAVRSAVAFVGFSVGLVAGAHLAGKEEPKEPWPRRVTLALAVELVLLAGLTAGFQLAGPDPLGVPLNLLIATSAAAMGIQSAAARRLSVSGIATTYVTGTLTSLMTELAAFGPGSRGVRWASIIAALLAGAALGALLLVHLRAAAPFLPLAVLTVVVATAALCLSGSGRGGGGGSW